MRGEHESSHLNQSAIISFSIGLITAGLKLLILTIFRPKKLKDITFEFAEFYSKLWDIAEHSISHKGFDLPSTLGDRPVNRVNKLLSKIYGGRFACLSLSGSSGALITLLTAVLPKFHPDRDLILFDDNCHQSALGGIIFGRWKAMRLQRVIDPNYETVRPLTCEDINIAIESCDAKRIAAIVLVSPSYDGFTSPTEIQKIYTLAKSLNITIIIDGAWDSMRFRQQDPKALPLESLCDIWITSPHKRGLTPSSLGCMITQNERIAELWDEAQDLGFRSSSISFVDIMIAEHRLQQISDGGWNLAFSKIEKCAELLRDYIPNIHPLLIVVDPTDIEAETTDTAHILVSTKALPQFDSRLWAKLLSSQFNFDIEKATRSTLLLLCGSPAHLDQLDIIKSTLKKSFEMTLDQSSVRYVN